MHSGSELWHWVISFVVLRGRIIMLFMFSVSHKRNPKSETGNRDPGLGNFNFLKNSKHFLGGNLIGEIGLQNFFMEFTVRRTKLYIPFYN